MKDVVTSKEHIKRIVNTKNVRMIKEMRQPLFASKRESITIHRNNFKDLQKKRVFYYLHNISLIRPKSLNHFAFLIDNKRES